MEPPPVISLRDERIHLLVAGSDMSPALLSLDARVHVSAGLEELKREPPVMRALEKWWEWVPRRESYMMETASFLSLNALLYEHLVPELCAAFPNGAWLAAEVDWVAAGGSEGAINFSQFSNSLLTLADNFVLGGCEAGVVVDFLVGLLAQMKARLDVEAALPEIAEEEPKGSIEQGLTSIHEYEEVHDDIALWTQQRHHQRPARRPPSGHPDKPRSSGHPASRGPRLVGRPTSRGPLSVEPDDDAGPGGGDEELEGGQERDAMLMSSRRLVTSAGRRQAPGAEELERRASSGEMVISHVGKPGVLARGGTRRQYIASEQLRPASAMERPLSAAPVELRPFSASPGQSYPVRVRPTTAGIVRRLPQGKAAGGGDAASVVQRPHSAMESAHDTGRGADVEREGGVHARPRTAVGWQRPGEVGQQSDAGEVAASGGAASQPLVPRRSSTVISSLLRESSDASEHVAPPQEFGRVRSWSRDPSAVSTPTDSPQAVSSLPLSALACLHFEPSLDT